jgi:prevent-host-death family protein
MSHYQTERHQPNRMILPKALDGELYETYNLYMNSVSSSHARQNWAETVEAAKIEPLIITDHGRPTVAVMDADLAKLALQVLEDSRDIERATAALEEYRADGVSYSLEDVAAELGIKNYRRFLRPNSSKTEK